MNLNFWQWLGVILLIVGVGYYFYDHFAADDPVRPQDAPPPATQPM